MQSTFQVENDIITFEKHVVKVQYLSSDVLDLLSHFGDSVFDPIVRDPSILLIMVEK